MNMEPAAYVSTIEHDAIVRVLYGEARGEPAEGLVAIAYVILNRARTPAWWGNDVWSVCHKPAQFSCWNLNDPNCGKVIHLSPNDPDYYRIAVIVDSVLLGKIPDPTGGATHYKVTGTQATWDKATVGIAPRIIGHHSFYKLGPHA